MKAKPFAAGMSTHPLIVKEVEKRVCCRHRCSRRDRQVDVDIEKGRCLSQQDAGVFGRLPVHLVGGTGERLDTHLIQCY